MKTKILSIIAAIFVYCIVSDIILFKTIERGKPEITDGFCHDESENTVYLIRNSDFIMGDLDNSLVEYHLHRAGIKTSYK